MRPGRSLAKRGRAWLAADSLRRVQIPGAGWQSWPLQIGARPATAVPPQVLTGGRGRRAAR